MKNSSCIACGEPASMKTQCKEVVASFCNMHAPIRKMLAAVPVIA